jgi:hypothetical protein
MASIQAQIFLTGYCDQWKKVEKKVDKVPYENFPYCCNSDNTLKQEINFAKK